MCILPLGMVAGVLQNAEKEKTGIWGVFNDLVSQVTLLHLYSAQGLVCNSMWAPHRVGWGSLETVFVAAYHTSLHMRLISCLSFTGEDVEAQTVYAA